MSVRDAVDAPRVQSTRRRHWETALRSLEAEGGDVQWRERNLYFGGVSAVEVRGRSLEAAGDPRRGGRAVREPRLHVRPADPATRSSWRVWRKRSARSRRRG